MQIRRFKPFTAGKEPPEEVIEAAAEEADHDDTSVEDQLIDRLRINWESDPQL